MAATSEAADNPAVVAGAVAEGAQGEAAVGRVAAADRAVGSAVGREAVQAGSSGAWVAEDQPVRNTT
jgi:hypothetical protein